MNDEAPPIPLANPDLIGHSRAEAALRQAVNGGRMAHAWLFSGPKGIGKATLAYRLARYVLCRGSAEEAVGEKMQCLFGADSADAVAPALGLETDPEHPVFRRIIAGSHADLMVVERELDEKTGRAKGQILVDAVREVKGFLSMTAGEGSWRVVIIDGADEMNRNAANALLKALEEPPERTLLVLVCHNAGRLLPTIRSRCRHLPLRPPLTGEGAAYLRRWHPELDSAAAARLLAIADGSIGLALELAEKGDLVDALGGVLTGLSTGDTATDLHKLAGRLGQVGNEADFELFARWLRWLLERIVVVKSGGPMPDALIGEETQRLAALASLDRWLEVWENVSRLLDSVPVANLDRKQVALNSLLAVIATVRADG